tara:strand:+ start:3300 stop:3428 length:129 start_codon:yes stop_codon:yes gene_type:complete
MLELVISPCQGNVPYKRQYNNAPKEKTSLSTLEKSLSVSGAQ